MKTNGLKRFLLASFALTLGIGALFFLVSSGGGGEYLTRNMGWAMLALLLIPSAALIDKNGYRKQYDLSQLWWAKHQAIRLMIGIVQIPLIWVVIKCVEPKFATNLLSAFLGAFWGWTVQGAWHHFNESRKAA